MSETDLDQPRVIEAAFHDVRDSITRPDQALAVSHYFWREWAPRLGPEAVVLVLWARSVLATGTNGPGSWIQLPAQPEIARATGLGGEKAVRAALRRLEATGFVNRKRRQYRFDADRGQTVHEPDRYLVSMSDPVVPEDEGQLEELRAVREELTAVQTGIPGLIPEVIHSANSVPAPRAVTLHGRAPCAGPEGRHTRTRICNELGSVPALRAPTTLEAESKRTFESKRKSDANVPRSREEKKAESEALVDDLVAGLGDGQSRAFYRKLAAQMPEIVVRAALSETQDAYRRGTLRRSRGAYFTDIVKRQAAGLGIALSARKA